MHYKKPKYEISLRKLENILSEVLRSSANSRQLDLDNRMRRAIRHIQIIKRTAPNNEDGDLAMVKAYQVYDRLQRLANYPQYFADNTRYAPQRVVSDRFVSYNARPASIRWDVASMMAVPMGGPDRNWGRPPLRPAPVKHYTREELEIEYPAFTVSKKREDAT